MRAPSPDLTRLRDGGRGATRGRQWGRDLLVVGQTALALVLLIGSALLVQSFQKLREVDPGYETEDIYTFQFAPSQPSLDDGPSLGRMHLNFMDRLRALPGVSAVGVVNNLPLDEGTGSGRFLTDGMGVDDTGVPRTPTSSSAVPPRRSCGRTGARSGSRSGAPAARRRLHSPWWAWWMT